jgi:putative hydrolase of the HAD superfamily
VRNRNSPKVVLFDLDDTLFDHRHAARSALGVIHTMQSCFSRAPFEDFERAHAGFLEELHQQVVAGAMGIDEARIERFRRLFAAAGVEADQTQLTSTATAYRRAYLAARRPVQGARVLLSVLHPRVRIGIVSNNLLDEQREKVRRCGFEPFVDALIVSEEVGVSKPHPAIFGHALHRLECAPGDAVMIGDSWTADVEGARAAGIRAIWFNRSDGTPPDTAQEITMLAAFDPIGPALEAIFPCVLA